MFWCLNLLKTAILAEKSFNAGKWVLTLCFIFGIFILMMDTLHFRVANDTSTMVKISYCRTYRGNADSFGNQVTNAFNSLNDIMVSLWNEGWKRWSGLFSPDTFAALAVFAGMFCFGVFI